MASPPEPHTSGRPPKEAQVNPLDGPLRLIEGLKPYPPPRRRFEDLRRTAKDLPLRAAQNPGPESGRALSRAAYLYWQIALAARHRDLIDICFEYWLRIGPLGWILAVRYLLLDTTDPKVIEHTLGNLYGRDQLLLLNQIVKIRRTSASPVMDWARASLADPSTRRNLDKLAFVLTLKRNSASLSPVLREALLREGFSIWLGTRITNPPMEEDGIAAAEAAGFLADRTLDTALTKGLRSAGPDLRTAVLRAVMGGGARRSPELIREVLSVLKESDRPRTCLIALEALISMEPPNIEKVYAHLLNRMPEYKDDILRSTLLLDGSRYAAVSELLSPEDREHADRLLLKVLLEADPEWIIVFIADYIRNVPRKYAMEQRSLDELKKFFASYRDANILVPEAEAVIRPRSASEDEPDAPLDFGAKLGSMLKLGKPEKTKHRSATSDFFGNMAGKKIDSPALSDVPVNGSIYRETEVTGGDFENVVFTDCSFDRAVFDNCRFVGCRFENCSFREARFTQALFQWSFMKTCDFRDSAFTSCNLTGLVASRSGMAGARFTETEYALSSTRETDFTGAVFERTMLTGSRFDGADFSYAKLASSMVRGVELRECVFKCMVTADCDLSSSRTDACMFKDCLNVHVRTDSANMPAQILAGLRDRIRAACICSDKAPAATDAPAWVSSPGCYEMIMQLVDGWFIHRDLKARESLARRLVRNRQRMGLESLGLDRNAFMVLLPTLLSAGLPFPEPDTEAEDIPRPAPNLKIAGFTPPFSAWELVQEHFGIFEINEPGPDAPAACALFALPPYGSMLQSPLDPVRILICLESGMSPDRESAFRAGLARIRKFAQEKFRMDVEFYLIHDEQLRSSNMFKPEAANGGAEIPWTRDDLLFKFVLLAGRLPLWWLAPADADDTQDAEYLERIKDLPMDSGARFLDTGNPCAPAEEEDAALLLDRVEDVYPAPVDAAVNLCLLLGGVTPSDPIRPSARKLKENLFSGKTNLPAVDHAALSVLAGLKALGRNTTFTSSNPTPLLFAVKTWREGAENDLFSPGRAGGNRFTKALCAKAGIFGEAHEAAVKSGTNFAGMVRAGKLAADFLLEGMDDLVLMGTTADTEDDARTKTAEKTRSAMAARLAPQPGDAGKYAVLRIPFLSPMSRAFATLSFRAEKTPGRPTVWIAGGIPFGAEREETVELKRDIDLARLVTWLAANKLYTPATGIEADYTASPVMPEDLRNLMGLLGDLFPDHDRHRPGLPALRISGLISRVLFIINLTAPREADTIFHASAVYRDGVGVMHCFSKQIFSKRLQERPREYLQAELPNLSAGRAELFVFKPAKSRSPSIRL